VQAEFDRGVAHAASYWFLIARRKFEGILQQDPTCAMAYWGVAMDYSAYPGNHADAGRGASAWDALERARVVGTKTPRERDWSEALSAYFRDHDKVAVGARLAAYMPRWSGCRKAIPMTMRYQVLLCADAASLGAESVLPTPTRSNPRRFLRNSSSRTAAPRRDAHTSFTPTTLRSLADKGIAGGARYAGIAPAVPARAAHPSHIYSMLSELWEDIHCSNGGGA